MSATKKRRWNFNDAVRALCERAKGAVPVKTAAAGMFYNLWGGGDSEGVDPFDVFPRGSPAWGELERGTEHELEHTDDVMVAAKIALDHLVEDPAYYSKLEAAGL